MESVFTFGEVVFCEESILIETFIYYVLSGFVGNPCPQLEITSGACRIIYTVRGIDIYLGVTIATLTGFIDNPCVNIRSQIVVDSVGYHPVAGDVARVVAAAASTNFDLPVAF